MHTSTSAKRTQVPADMSRTKAILFFSGKSFSSILHGAPESGKTVPHTSLRQGRIEFSPPKRIVFFFYEFLFQPNDCGASGGCSPLVV